ncbi:4'-phosphopantetheinyl transferase superfamily protein [Cellvibrio sp. OA-2007]
MSTPFTPLHTPRFETARPLRADEVHIWCLDINQFTTAHFADAARVMNPSERERAQKFVRGKESYIASRWLLRKVLARYTGATPEAIEFLRSDKGKPYLPQRDIHFSLSHSGHWALLAVSNIELIGVDIEAVSSTRDLTGIAESYYHPREFAHLQTLAGDAQHDYFYRLWTLKEAFFKAIGTGISAGLEKIAFELANDRIHAQIAAELNQDRDEWQFHQWTLGAQNYAALASKCQQPLTPSWFDVLSVPAFP